jgi:hypothetical protein
MTYELVEFFEGSFVEQQIDAFTGAKLALFMFALAAFGAPTGFSLRIKLAQLVQAVVVFAMTCH